MRRAEMHPAVDYPNFQSAVADTHFPSAQGGQQYGLSSLCLCCSISKAGGAGGHSTLQAMGTTFSPLEFPHPSLGL